MTYYERISTPANGSCFYHSVAGALLDDTYATEYFGLTGHELQDALRLRKWIASTLLTDHDVQQWLYDRLQLVAESPEIQDEFDFIGVGGGMSASTEALARAIINTSTWASEFEVDVMRLLLARVEIALVVCYMPGCTAGDAAKTFAKAEHAKAIMLMCENLHYDFMCAVKGSAIMRTTELIEMLS